MSTLSISELRIGNFVSDIHASDTFYAKVKKLDYSICYYGHFYSSYNDLKPIPLTEEWLLKFGFDKKENRLFVLKLKHGYYSLAYYEEMWYIFDDNNDAACNCIAKLEYVHQLQNLYFALTNQELILKP